MARRKQTVTQRSFTLGQLRSEFLEADDLELRGNSLRRARNVRITSARTAKARPGTLYRRVEATARQVYELRPTTDAVFGLILTDTQLKIIDADARVIRTFPAPYADPADAWVEPLRTETLIGGPFGIKELVYDNGDWSMRTFTFAGASGGEIAQPYWVFTEGIGLKPTGTSGAINITASQQLFSPAWVGQRIRWARREIQLTGYSSPTVMSGVVTTELTPTFEIVVQSATSFRVGDAVVGDDTNYQGQIVGISGTSLFVVTLEFLDGPDIDERLSSPSGGSDVVSKTVVAPLFTEIWDEPLISGVRGYPRAASSAAGRLILTDFPLVPSLVAASSTRSIYDWEVGAADDDAITREVGDGRPRFLHAVNAGDLLLFSDRGCYYVPLRDNGILSPSTFNAVFFDDRSASPVKPVKVDSGVVFVESSGNSIAAALLDGNIYLKWSVRPISTQHSDLVNFPKKLCGPSLNSTLPEKYLFVVNGDGTLAAVSWVGDFGGESVGFVGWDTEGVIESVTPLFGGYWPIVRRDIGGTDKRFIEEFSEDAYLDCTVPTAVAQNLVINEAGETLRVGTSALTLYTAQALPLSGAEVHIYGGGYYGGTVTVAADGSIDSDNLTIDSVAGFNFIADLDPWPVEVLQSPYAGMKKCRTVRTSISIFGTSTFQCIANGITREVEGYRAGDDILAPPPVRTETHRFSVFGLRDHPDIRYRKHLPGPFHVLAITSEVTV